MTTTDTYYTRPSQVRDITMMLDATSFEDANGTLIRDDLHYWLNWNGFTFIKLAEDRPGDRTIVAFASKDETRYMLFLKRSGE